MAETVSLLCIPRPLRFRFTGKCWFKYSYLCSLSAACALVGQGLFYYLCNANGVRGLVSECVCYD